MKAVVMERRHGGPEMLKMREVPTPTPKANEILVRVHAASINDWDWGLLQGSPSLIEHIVGRLVTPKVQILGGDIAGRVEAVGDAYPSRPRDQAPSSWLGRADSNAESANYPFQEIC